MIVARFFQNAQKLEAEKPSSVGLGQAYLRSGQFDHAEILRHCPVAIELKVDRFEPEYLGKLNFYLEALDRNVRKAHEQPAIGVLLCASKNDEVGGVRAKP